MYNGFNILQKMRKGMEKDGKIKKKVHIKTTNFKEIFDASLLYLPASFLPLLAFS